MPVVLAVFPTRSQPPCANSKSLSSDGCHYLLTPSPTFKFIRHRVPSFSTSEFASSGLASIPDFVGLQEQKGKSSSHVTSISLLCLSLRLTLKQCPGIHPASVVAPYADDINYKLRLPRPEQANCWPPSPDSINHQVLSAWSRFRHCYPASAERRDGVDHDLSPAMYAFSGFETTVSYFPHLILIRSHSFLASSNSHRKSIHGDLSSALISVGQVR